MGTGVKGQEMGMMNGNGMAGMNGMGMGQMGQMPGAIFPGMGIGMAMPQFPADPRRFVFNGD